MYTEASWWKPLAKIPSWLTKIPSPLTLVGDGEEVDWNFKDGEEKKVFKKDLLGLTLSPNIFGSEDIQLEKKCNTTDGPKGNNIRLGIVCSTCTWWKGMVDGKKRDHGASDQESILLEVQDSPNTAKVYC